MEKEPFKKKGEESARDLAAQEEREIERQGHAAEEASTQQAPETPPSDQAWEQP